MPQLRDWRLLHPRDWQPRHVVDYLTETRDNLRVGIEPTALAAGPIAAVGVLLTVAVDIVQRNPQVRDRALEVFATMFERIEAVEPARVQ